MTQPTVAILLAVWEPREDWLIELLDSLNAQAYPHLHLYVRDDASPTYPLSRLRKVLEEHITAFAFTLHQNERNLGSNQTFGALIRDCCEPYVAFCDQDDVWLPDKIANTLHLLQGSPLEPVLVCANVAVIDGDGKPLAARMEEHRRRHVFRRGTGLDAHLIYRNFAMGCTMMLARERALSYLPIPETPVHDHYLAFRAARDGAIDYLDTPQMLYRVYGGNQTGVMTGVKTKADYYERRIAAFARRLSVLEQYADTEELRAARRWCEARMANFRREKGGFRALWRLRGHNRVTSLFELFALRFPAPLFRLAIRLVQKGAL